MKTPVPPPYRLGELRERVIASLADADDERRLPIIGVLAGGLDDPEYRPWEYYCCAEPVPEGLTREGVVVRGTRCARLDGPAHPLVMKDGTRLTLISRIASCS